MAVRPKFVRMRLAAAAHPTPDERVEIINTTRKRCDDRASQRQDEPDAPDKVWLIPGAAFAVVPGRASWP